jgi:hypothetical protein
MPLFFAEQGIVAINPVHERPPDLQIFGTAVHDLGHWTHPGLTNHLPISGNDLHPPAKGYVVLRPCPGDFSLTTFPNSLLPSRQIPGAELLDIYSVFLYQHG